MQSIRKLKHPKTGGRVETGVVQFGQDWPGVFIRGDNAFYWAQILGSTNQPIDQRVADLMTLLNESNLVYRRRRDAAARLANRPYQIEVKPDETGGYFARVKECEGCVGSGETYEAAVDDVRSALIEWIDLCLEIHIQVPDPELLKYLAPTNVEKPEEL